MFGRIFGSRSKGRTEKPTGPEGTQDLAPYLERARDLLRQALEIERPQPIPSHSQWEQARLALRNYILKEDFSAFLQHEVCRYRFYRSKWRAGQKHELKTITSSEWGRSFLEEFVEPRAGMPEMSRKLPQISVNMLGMVYYLARLRQFHGTRLPKNVVELGGGYGAFCYAFLRANPQAAYAIIDLPEMLALQHYFLSIGLPDRRITLAAPGEMRLRAGQVLLVPTSLGMQADLEADTFFSTFAISEMPAELQQAFQEKDFFAAKTALIVGQLFAEDNDSGWAPHAGLASDMMWRFTDIRIERFHIGMNYLMLASRR